MLDGGGGNQNDRRPTRCSRRAKRPRPPVESESDSDLDVDSDSESESEGECNQLYVQSGAYGQDEDNSSSS